MNCNVVQDKLSEFIDKKLDVATHTIVEDHLSFCAPCRSEVEDLSYSIQLAADEPDIEPPLAFTTRVMARVRERAEQPSLWNRVLGALRFGVPAQAMAVVVIVVLAGFLYQKERSTESVPRIAQSDSAARTSEVTDQLAAPAAKPSSSEFTNSRFANEPGLRSGAQGVAEPQPAPPASGRVSERAADLELTVRITSSARDQKSSMADRDTALPQELRESLEQARQRAIQAGQPQTVLLRVSANRYDQFKKELTSIGAIEVGVGSAQAAPQPVEWLQVKITLVPPSSHGR